MIDNLPKVDYYTLIVTVPEDYADAIRDVLAQAGAGRFGNYTHCTFSVKGIGQYMPQELAHPTVGKPNQLVTIKEERIETVCAKEYLEQVITAIKKAHPYETTIIDIYPVFKLGIKTNS